MSFPYIGLSLNRCLVALLIMGSAISLFSCQEHSVVVQKGISTESLMSEMSDTLTVIVSENGRPSYRFYAPLVEGYSMAREPYREFRRGVDIITYIDDSLSMVDATLTANYAIYYSNLKLWEAKGDVVVIKHDGKELYTQQLFWNSTTKRIYSNVDTKIVDTSSDDIYYGEGFESDEEMKQWSFRKMKGTMKIDTTPTEPADSTVVDIAIEREPQESSAEAEAEADAEANGAAAAQDSLKEEDSSAERPQKVDSTKIEAATKGGGEKRSIGRAPSGSNVSEKQAEVSSANRGVGADKRDKLEQGSR